MTIGQVGNKILDLESNENWQKGLNKEKEQAGEGWRMRRGSEPEEM